MTAHDPALERFVRGAGLFAAGVALTWTPLTGGVSSDIWKVEGEGRAICVKRALPRLKVAADWTVPTERNGYEWAWMVQAERVCPTAVPQLLAQDEAGGAFAMAFLDPANYPQWKAELEAGRVDVAAAAEVGRRLALIHARTADRADLEAAFNTTDLFRAIRLDAYFTAAGVKNPDLAPALAALCEATANTRRALVHGDVSPKNILLGPRGPVFLDAECAWYGDPAFDLAFCLNHLLLDASEVPTTLGGRLQSFAALRDAYLAGVTWERLQAVEARAAALLPAMMLARVDGKSPLANLATQDDKARVRRVATPFIAAPPAGVSELAEAWRAAGRAGSS